MVIFDTVFTTVGSSEVFVVYNRNDQPVKVSSIRLRRPATSRCSA